MLKIPNYSVLARSWLTVFILVFISLNSAGCGNHSNNQSVGSFTLELDRTELPLGGPINLSFQFDVAQSHEPLDEDYRVFVHFLDANGEMMWAEDHYPATPTSLWRAGQSISYAHRVQIPMYPYVGDSVIAIGLYSENTGKRLVLTGEDLGNRTYRGEGLTLHPKPDGSLFVYEDGWHELETNDTGKETWRWTTDQASLSFNNPRVNAFLYLEIDGRSDLFDKPQNLVVKVNDATVYETAVGVYPAQFHRLHLTKKQMGDQETFTLSLEVDKTFVPSSIKDEAMFDDRNLGIRVKYVFIEPA